METVSGRNEEEGFFLSFGRDRARLFLCRASKGGGSAHFAVAEARERRGGSGGGN